ncbi:hypothetical protein [Paractinoplanes maris]|uniref:hypothetical protein n=1 Tax=Paractinoplanes maris TaxID=1734446 RepID=UPI002020E54C|nr:hypothetical protein [Actinoplanes maris]
MLPLGVSAAACSLFQSSHLGLRHPAAGAPPTGETVLVWGGSTSAGSNAIQLAVAAGYDVITTASPRNADRLADLGAARVFDYRSPAVAVPRASVVGHSLSDVQSAMDQQRRGVSATKLVVTLPA